MHVYKGSAVDPLLCKWGHVLEGSFRKWLQDGYSEARDWVPCLEGSVAGQPLALWKLWSVSGT